MQHAKDGLAGPQGGSFAAGTLLAVPGPDGTPLDRAVETLRPGDAVLTTAGATLISDIHARRIDVAGHPAPLRVAPVRLRAGALGGELPRHDLVVPQEALLLFPTPSSPAGGLVPAGVLVNGISILRESAAGIVSWYTLTLDQPEIVLAEGVAAAGFHGPLPPPPLSAEPAPQGRGRKRKSESAPAAPPSPKLLPPGPAVLALRAGLNALAERMQAANSFDPLSAGAAVDDTAHPLRLFINGNELPADPDSTETHFTFTLPAGTGPVRLISRAHDSPSPQDKRRLGVCVVALALDGVALELEGPIPGRGFHVPEGEEGMRWRWMDGDAWLVLPHQETPRRLAVQITTWHRNLKPSRG